MPLPGGKLFTAAFIHLRATVHTIRQQRRRATILSQLRSRHPVTLQLHVPGMGLFAHLSWIILGLEWAERHGHKIHFSCTNAHYNQPGAQEDWLGSVVEQSTQPAGRVFLINNYFDLPFATEQLGNGRGRMHALIQERLRPRANLVAQCDRWFQSTAAGNCVIGLHYRGTDKRAEAPRLRYEAAITSTNLLVAELAKRTALPIAVFVATDEAAFLSSARQNIQGARVLAHDHFARVEGTDALHTAGSNDGPRLAREAMLDALLLSRCHVLAKTASALSGWSALLNEKIPVLFLSQPHAETAFYPDCMLAPDSFAIGQEEYAAAAAILPTA
jgi:hypothetical protein